MQHQPDSAAQEQAMSPASASQYLAEHYESIDPANFDPRLDAILDGPPFLAPTHDQQQSLEKVADEFFRDFYSGDDLWGMDSHRMPGDSVMGGKGDGVYVPQYEPETLELVMALQEAGSYEQANEGKELAVAQEQTKEPEEHMQQQVQEEIASQEDQQQLPETQNTEAERSSSWNPYSDSHVGRQYMSSAMAKKRKNNEPEHDDAAKKHQSETSRASLLSPPSTPELSYGQAVAGASQPSIAVALSGQAQYASPEVPQNAEMPPNISPMANLNNVLVDPHHDAATPLLHNSPAAWQYAPPASPYTLQPLSPYSRFTPASPYNGYVPPTPAAYVPTPPYPGYAPAWSTDPAALQYNPPSALPPTPAATKVKSHTPDKKPIPRASSDIPVVLRHITRGIQNRATDVLYQAALDINQYIFDWHEERDRLAAMMENKKLAYDANNPDDEKWSPEARDARKKLMGRIRGFEKKFALVNAELEKRGLVVPV
ncbi:hypothetical protein P171DRAFT_479400 [Karstenula rhodostoma CBS 690.94]|uniref:Uncharacterized protein n=1 Tax=Karstenula rhodostoma CBS 690.94 TaxID=1392251 RepID=A0A9P4PTS8_9PLEO|nr:hypothetical protein P171DRAFT_479400 [Karstenula rhodostoma CBS 690.94]